MTWYRKVIWVVCLWATSGITYGQESLQTKTLNLEVDTIDLGSGTISVSSVKLYIDGAEKDKNQLFIDYANGKVVIPESLKINTPEIKLSYKKFPIDFTETYQHKTKDLIQDKIEVVENPFAYKVEPKAQAPWEIEGLNKQGSLSRGILVGNNQNLSVNSHLNLQLSGKLTDDISVLASISDQNIPIQPGGNTQQLQEFDQVYIQVFNDRNKLIAGDFTLSNPKSYFMRYFKRAQGGSFQTTNQRDKLKHTLQASAALSRGKFARNIIQGLEGNQGPYRLVGSSNEPFITVLSGTERVYVDGKLLLRGQENDYTIDYNTAELTFTAKQLITKDKRIIVEFQYSVLSYQRSLFQVANEIELEKWKLGIHLYSEQDSKNQTIQTDIDQEDRQFLAGIGDQLDKAIISSADTANFNTKLVLYELTDSVVNGVTYDSIYSYSQSEEVQLYRLIFTEVGYGRGNYIQSNTIANGRVFSWVAPSASGVPSGNFEPVVLVETPKQQQMLVVNGKYEGASSNFSFEGTVTNYDKNTYSELSQTDDIGGALKADYLQKFETKKIDYELGGGFEFWNRNLKEIERIRSVEFYRDWNLRDVALTEDQVIGYAQVGVKTDALKINNKTSSFTAGTNYEAVYNQTNADLNYNLWIGNYRGSLLRNQVNEEAGNFYRHKINLTKQLGLLKLGYRDDFERNLKTNSPTDTLLKQAYQFYEYELYLTNPDTLKNRYKIFYVQRSDFGSSERQIKLATLGQSYGGEYHFLTSPVFQAKARVALRQLEVLDPELTSSEADNTLLNRLEYNLKLLKGAIRTQSFYEVNSGLESRKEYTFLEVAAGQGSYTWNDYNDNGIKEVEEFEIAIYQDQANYIKVYFPTNDYVQTYVNQFSQNIFLNPSVIWRSPKGFKKFVTRFSDQVVFRQDRKTTQSALTNNLNPFLNNQNIADSSLLSTNRNLRNSLFFNRTARWFATEFTYQNVQSKTLLTNGFESRFLESYAIKPRLNIKQSLTFNLDYESGIKKNRSDFFNRRDYNIHYSQLEPRVTFLMGTRFRVSAFVKYNEKANKNPIQTDLDGTVLSGGESAILRTIGLESRLAALEKGNITANLNYVNIAYNGNQNSPVAFEMLESLQQGDNATWSVFYQRTLANNLQIDVNYNGRISNGNNAIHSGGVQVRAFF